MSPSRAISVVYTLTKIYNNTAERCIMFLLFTFLKLAYKEQLIFYYENIILMMYKIIKHKANSKLHQVGKFPCPFCL